MNNSNSLLNKFKTIFNKPSYKQHLITEYYDHYENYSKDLNRDLNNKDLKKIIIDSNTSNTSNSIDIVIDRDIKDIKYNLSDKIYGYNEETGNWHCLECGDNMGDNPRQLCGKSYCFNYV